MVPAGFNFKFRTIYLLAITACGIPHAVAQQANFNITTLYSFPAYTGDGSNSRAGLILDSSGALYGTTAFGGANGAATCSNWRLRPSPAAPGPRPYCTTSAPSTASAVAMDRPLVRA